MSGEIIAPLLLPLRTNITLCSEIPAPSMLSGVEYQYINFGIEISSSAQVHGDLHSK